MSAENDGVPVTNLIAAVKDAVIMAGVTRGNPSSDLRVDSVQLILEVIATELEGGRLSFRVPFIGTELSLSGRRTRRDTHTIDITLVPPDQPVPGGVRGRDVQEALVEAIRRIRQTMNSAAGGDDPWILSAGIVDISFGVTREGTISVGAEGALANEATNTLRLKLIPA